MNDVAMGKLWLTILRLYQLQCVEMVFVCKNLRKKQNEPGKEKYKVIFYHIVKHSAVGEKGCGDLVVGQYSVGLI